MTLVMVMVMVVKRQTAKTEYELIMRPIPHCQSLACHWRWWWAWRRSQSCCCLFLSWCSAHCCWCHCRLAL